MRTREKYLISSTKVDRLYVKMWLPDREPDVIVQIAHGMIEHIGRYEELAEFLCAHGIGVVGNDHLGHGKTAAGSSQYGYFAGKNGKEAVLADMHLVTRYIKRQYPKCRLFLLGHSMGSFFSRKYITRYDRRLSGVILTGTGYYPVWEAAAGKLLAGILMIARGEFYRSSLLYELTIGGFARCFSKCECKSWVTSDQEQADKYEKDPLCSFRFTASAYYDLFSLLLELSVKKGFGHIRKDLPVLMLSGDKDPVGGFGKGVRRVHRDFLRLGLKDVQLKLYSNDRHEVLNEVNRAEVYQDILEWICEKCTGGGGIEADSICRSAFGHKHAAE